MIQTQTTPLYDQLLSHFHPEKFSAAPRVMQLQAHGLESFKKTGFPTRRTEEWKYTPVGGFLRETYSLNGIDKQPALQPEWVAQAHIPGLDAIEIVLLNGVLQPIQSELPATVKVQTLSYALNDEKVQGFIGQNTALENAPFAALNTALFADGLFIEIAPKAILEKPLHIIHLYTAEHNRMLQPRQLVVVHPSAQITLIESVVRTAGGARVFINNVCEVVVEENASCDHYMIQSTNESAAIVNQVDVGQKRHSVYTSYTFAMPGAALIRNNLNVDLNAAETETHLYGLMVGRDKQLLDVHSFINHKEPNCQSNEIFKTILRDESNGVFSGKVYVHQEAQKTNAFQQNNSLLLSEKATVNAKPMLEIFADDVRCSHGATVGQLSREALFYLQSRGIGEAAARDLLVNAFAFEVTEKIKIPALEAYVNELIVGKGVDADVMA